MDIQIIHVWFLALTEGLKADCHVFTNTGKCDSNVAPLTCDNTC